MCASKDTNKRQKEGTAGSEIKIGLSASKHLGKNQNNGG